MWQSVALGVVWKLITLCMYKLCKQGYNYVSLYIVFDLHVIKNTGCLWPYRLNICH